MTEWLIIAVPLLVAPIVFLVAFSGCASLARVTPPSPPPTPTASENYKSAISGTGGLMGYWRLGDKGQAPSYPPAKDEEGIANGQYLGSPTLGVQGPPPTKDSDAAAIGLNGSDSFVQVPYLESLNPVEKDGFSIEAWIWPEPPNKLQGNDDLRVILSSYSLHPHGYQLHVYRSQANPNPELRGLAFPTGFNGLATADIVYGAWQQVVMTYSNGTIRLYVNGSSLGTVATPVKYEPNNITDPTDRQPLRIGAGLAPGGVGYFFQGKIAEVSIYRGALSDGDIKKHYDASQM